MARHLMMGGGSKGSSGSGGGGAPPAETGGQTGGLGGLKTPIYYNPTIVAGGYHEIRDHGKYLSLVSITGATSLRMAFDEDPLQVVQPRRVYECDRPYNRIIFYNPAGVPVTVELTIGETRVEDNGGDIVALLTTIAARLAGVATMTQPTIITLAATGAAPTVVRAASATRRRISVEAALTNTGTVYLGNAAAHCTDADSFAQLAPGQAWSDDYYLGGVWGVGSDATQQVVVYEE